MKRFTAILLISFYCFSTFSCTTITPPVVIPVETNKQTVSKSIEKSRKPFIKRKVAIGRFTNETNYGKGFFDKSNENTIGRQAMDILSTRLTQSEKFIMLEREDMDLINSELKMNNLNKGILLFALLSLIFSIFSLYSVNNNKQKIELINSNSNQLENNNSNEASGLTSPSLNKTLIKDLTKIGEKRSELISCLWYENMMLNLNTPENPNFEYYSDVYNNLLESITESENKDDIIKELNDYCSTNRALMFFLLLDRMKIILE